MPTAKERINQLAQVTNALERLKERDREVPEGRADGVRGGEVSDLAHSIAGNAFATEVVRCLHDHYAIEGINPDAVKSRSALVVIRIDRDGSFLESHLEHSSGLPAFDRAVERALKLCGKVSPPPETMRDQVRNDGFEVEFQP